MFLSFATQSKSQQYSGEKLLNWFARPAGEGVGEVALISRSGLVCLARPSTESVKAITHMNGDIYAVSDGTVWKYVVSTGSVSNVGTVAIGNTSIAASGAEVAIVVGGKYYVCDGTTTQEYGTGAMVLPTYVVFVDGYFVLSGTVGGRGDGLTISGLDDGTTFDAVDFAFAENAPDAIRGMIADHGRVYVFGSTTVETFWNSGAADFPFIPSKSEVMETGCFAGETVAKMDNAVYWVGEDRVVHRTFGGSPEVISTPEIKEALDASAIELAFRFIDRGHEFYAIRRTGKSTLCVDVTTGLWSERSTGVAEGSWTATCATVMDGVTYFGSATGDISTPNSEVMTDNGQAILGEAISKPLVQGGDPFTINRLKLRAETSNTAASPEIMMQVSRNGTEWGTEKWRSLGGIGEYNKRIEWHGLGEFEQAQVRFRVTDPVRRDLYGISVE